MISGEHDLNVLIYTLLDSVQLDVARTGDPANLVDVPVFATIPEESVIPASDDDGIDNYPSITFFPYDDMSLEGAPLRHQVQRYRPVDENNLSLGYNIFDHPMYRRLFYQIDLYTRNYQDMLSLQKELFLRLKREFGFLTDEDGAFIYFRLIDVQDLTDRVDEERFYRRAFSYSFDAWVLENRDPIDTVGPVEQIDTEIRDSEDESLLVTITVPEP